MIPLSQIPIHIFINRYYIINFIITNGFRSAQNDFSKSFQRFRSVTICSWNVRLLYSNNYGCLASKVEVARDPRCDLQDRDLNETVGMNNGASRH
jgi:hypothetical protein